MRKNIRLKSGILALVAGFSVMAMQTALADELAVQLIGVNDFHGALDATGTARLENETVRDAGTAALLGTYMDDAETEFRSETAEKKMPAESIRVQAGDMVGASPSNSALLQDEPTVKVLNKMKIDYGTLGNHEFDEGLEEYNRIMTGKAPKPGQFNPIVDNYNREAATQEMVIANVIDKKTGEIPYGWKPYAIRTVSVNNGKEAKIGFIGVVTTEIPNLVLKKNYEEYTFLDEAETIAKYARELTEEKGVKAIVVLAHVPATSKDGIAAGESADMIEKLNKIYPENSVDVVFAGHNHVHTNGITGKTLIVQATSQGKAYADVRAVYDTDIADFKTVPTAKVVAVAPNKKTPNPEIQAIVDEANVIVKQVTEQRIGTASQAVDISREVNEFKESSVGNLVTAAQLAIAKKSGYNVDFAMTNDGGIRADLKVQEDGTVTWGSAQAVQPFGNILQIVQMTGEQIYKALNQQYDEEEKYFLQLAGLRYTYTVADNPTAENPYKVVKAFEEDGTEIVPTKTYTVVINDFLLGGGDGFSVFKEAKLIGAINPDTEVFIEYLNDLKKAGRSISAEIVGRKTFVKQHVAEPKVGEKSDSTSSMNQEENTLPSNSEEKMDDKIRSDRDKGQTRGTTTKVDQTMFKKATGKQNLPKTGQAGLNSLLISLGGLVSLGMVVSVRRKENQ